MIVEKSISFRRLLQVIWQELLCILVVSALPVICLIYFDLGEYSINASIPLVIGTAIAIFLGFRTNSAYERWWEGRKLWGAIIVDSRSLIRLGNQYIGHSNRVEQRRLCFRQIAYTKILDHELKSLPFPEETKQFLDDEEYQRVSSARNPMLQLIALQSDTVGDALRRGEMDSRQAVLMEETLSRLTNHYGGCQRIKNTVFPVHYTFFTRVFIWIFIVLLAFSLPAHENANYSLIPAIFLIGWVFFMVEGIGSYMQDPFENNRNVIPMSSISRTVEIELKEAIGETELPEPAKPIDGALF
ncbi:MAG: bestrophin family protein [Rubripirellula sp.]